MEYSPSRPRDIKRPCCYFLTLDDNVFKTYATHTTTVYSDTKEQTEIKNFCSTQKFVEDIAVILASIIDLKTKIQLCNYVQRFVKIIR